ncbi:MAG TPA: hypothetical protein VFE33_25330 [Thermoanaerobaculia bacterium]|nr:hypothetical protein [Thermoanaerobaculia bacterium]
MRKGLKKLRLTAETLRDLDSLHQVVGGNNSIPPACSVNFPCRPPTQTFCESWCNICPVPSRAC